MTNLQFRFHIRQSLGKIYRDGKGRFAKQERTGQGE